MTDLSLIADLVRAGLDPDLVGRVVNALMDACREGIDDPPLKKKGAKNLSGRCAVYSLVDPDTDIPFYVGISKYPAVRLQQHKDDWVSSAHGRVADLLQKHPLKRLLKINQWCEDRSEALELEYNLIRSTPNLVNRDNSRPRRKPDRGAAR